ncbi:MAG TPA: radical SAM protein, partial [Longimicrobiales bacterium]|nr:radical SAM protein [Longimicrobiales bacterium]
MLRVLLVNPPSPERLGAPLLGLQYVAAALLERGCEVRVIDAAARHARPDAEAILAEVESFGPDMIGFGLFTRWVWHAYRLAERLRGGRPLLVAGGAHPTVRPDEALSHGFDVAVVGEAERTVVRLVDHLEGRTSLAEIAGIRYRTADGRVEGPGATLPIADLDGLPRPLDAQHLFRAEWYVPDGEEVIPGGILTSRGCPARCTFCANYVTGRGFRFRSAEDVIDELNAYHARVGATYYPFWDDALTAHRPRLRALCEAMADGVRFPLRWSA